MAPAARLAVAGVMAMAEMVLAAAVTVIAVVAETPFMEAAIFAVPAETPVTAPAEFALTTAVFEEDHATCAVTSELLPSLNAPVALSCSVSLVAMVDLGAAIEMDLRLGLDCVPVEEFELTILLEPQPVPTRRMRMEE